MLGKLRRKRNKSQASRETADVLACLPHNIETLREMQRVLQMEKMDHWMGELHAEKRRSRRIGAIFRFGMLTAVLAGIGNTAYLIHTLNSGGPQSELSDAHIAVVDVDSVIQAKGEASATRIISGLRRALDNDAVSAVVLNINSPGGSPTESQRVYHAIQDLRERHDIPIVSWIGDTGASGAYYMAAGTDAIYASPSSIVGSIGVISASFGFTDAMENLGVERRVYTAGENKAFLDPFLPEDARTVEQFGSVISDVHAQFIDDVRAGRGEALADADYDDVRFSGAVWSGAQAVDMGLVDETLMLETLFERLQPTDDGFPLVRNYSVRGNAMERLMRRLPNAAASALESLGDSNTLEMRYPSSHLR